MSRHLRVTALLLIAVWTGHLAAQEAAPGPGRVQTQSTATPWTTGTYAYDAAGNISQIGAERFVYDVYGRVKSGTAAGQTQEYTYDLYGNLTTIKTGTTTIPLTVNAGNNRLTAANGSPFGYDGAGQVLTTGSASYAYDGVGMMTSSQTAGGPVNLYVYTPSDERIATVLLTSGGAEASSTWSFRDASGKVLRRFNKVAVSGQWNWVWRQDYVYSDTLMLASENDAAPKTLHYFPDHLGTPRLITDQGGMQVGLASYFPFGAPATASGVDDVKKFTGHERDQGGLDYMHARYYTWGLGRFLTPDPGKDWDMQRPQTWNLYTYVRNNPVGNIDPTGRDTLSRGPSVAGAFGAYGAIGMNVNFDDKGNVSLTTTWAVGGGTLGAGLNFNESFSNAETVHDLAGTTEVAGLGGGNVITGGVEVAVANSKFDSITFSTGLGAKSLSSPIEGHGAVQHTVEIASVNVPAAVNAAKNNLRKAGEFLFNNLVDRFKQAVEGEPPDPKNSWLFGGLAQ
jgi:RHS repeat-associated protein